MFGNEGHSTALQSTECTLLLESSLLIYIIVATLYLIENVQDNTSFLWNVPHNFNVTDIPRYW